MTYPVKFVLKSLFIKSQSVKDYLLLNGNMHLPWFSSKVFNTFMKRVRMRVLVSSTVLCSGDNLIYFALLHHFYVITWPYSKERFLESRKWYSIMSICNSSILRYAITFLPSLWSFSLFIFVTWRLITYLHKLCFITSMGEYQDPLCLFWCIRIQNPHLDYCFSQIFSCDFLKISQIIIMSASWTF